MKGGKRLQGKIFSNPIPNGQENGRSYENASKHLVGSGPFSQTMCFKISTSRNFLNIPAVERMQIQGNIRNNIRKIPTLKQLRLLNKKDNVKSIPFKDKRVYTTRSSSVNRQEGRLSFT
jgi:hypothetical protein